MEYKKFLLMLLAILSDACLIINIIILFNYTPKNCNIYKILIVDTVISYIFTIVVLIAGYRYLFIRYDLIDNINIDNLSITCLYIYLFAKIIIIIISIAYIIFEPCELGIFMYWISIRNLSSIFIILFIGINIICT